MLVYLDSSVLARAYLPDEEGHPEARALLKGSDHLLVTASWTVVETTSALVRAAHTSRVPGVEALLAVMGEDTGEGGPVTLLRPDPDRVERRAVAIVRDHVLRSLDALHLAVAELAAVPLLEPGAVLGFASRDTAQRAAAAGLGFHPL